MAVLITEAHVLLAIKRGRLMCIKRLNAPVNLGKTAAMVMAEQLSAVLRDVGYVRQEELGEALLRRLEEKP